jgi:hypothetical protein
LLDNLNDTHLTLRDGAPVLIRRLVAEDATLYPDFLSDVIAEDLRLRFFESIREVNHDLLVKLINYDPDRAMAFIAVDEKSQKMLGVVACTMTQAEKTPNLPFWCARGSRATESVGY